MRCCSGIERLQWFRLARHGISADYRIGLSMHTNARRKVLIILHECDLYGPHATFVVPTNDEV